jgi:hypothetical protein
MPVMSGDEMLERLRATDWGAYIRVIVKAHHTPAEAVKVVEEVLG